MAYAMTKRGTQDNEIVYEFVCDGISDMNAIENRYRTIGSVAVVLRGESDDLEVYIADSHKSWTPMTSIAASGDDSYTGGGMTIHVCAQNEISSGKPNIAEPDETVIYLVANSSNETGNLYDEFVYVDSAWEKIGSAGIDLSEYAPIANPEFTGSISLGRKENTTVGSNSAAIGTDVTASHANSIAIGINSEAHSQGAFAQGYSTWASGKYSHAEGNNTTASAEGAHAEGINGEAKGSYSHVEGYFSRTETPYATVIGKYNFFIAYWYSSVSYEINDRVVYNNKIYKCISNIKSSDTPSNDTTHWEEDPDSYLYFTVGNGTNGNAFKSNAFAVTYLGNAKVKGDLYVGCNADSTGGNKVATEAFVTARVPNPPVADGTYLLQCTVTSGTPTYTWVSAPSASGVSF